MTLNEAREGHRVRQRPLQLRLRVPAVDTQARVDVSLVPRERVVFIAWKLVVFGLDLNPAQAHKSHLDFAA